MLNGRLGLKKQNIFHISKQNDFKDSHTGHSTTTGHIVMSFFLHFQILNFSFIYVWVSLLMFIFYYSNTSSTYK